jgi:UDP-2-acetamido-2,6-beta-L-arabino-hexul-4-ose reductase
MVVGNGMIAKEFIDYKNQRDVIVFASGVSDSNEINESEFKREEDLLTSTISKYMNKKFIYFSTCSMYDMYFPNNAYTQHKLRMERVISNNSKNYTIFRLSQAIGKNNKSQLLGFLIDKIEKGELFDLYDIERNIIDISDIKKIVDYVIQKNIFNNTIINIANKRNISVLSLVNKLENILNVKAKYRLIKKNGTFKINTENINFLLDELKIDDLYIETILRKYCA